MITENTDSATIFSQFSVNGNFDKKVRTCYNKFQKQEGSEW